MRKHKLDEYPDDINEFTSRIEIADFLKECEYVITHWDPEEALHKLDTVFGGVRRESFVIKDEVKEFVDTVEEGWWSVRDIYGRLQITTRQDRKNVVTCCIREKEAGHIEPHPTKNGWYRKVMADTEPIFWKGKKRIPMGIKWPFELEQLVNIYSGNIIVVAGAKDSGKTSFLLNTIKLNQDRYNIHYFTSEIAGDELALRLSLFEDMEESDWSFEAHKRNANYADAVIGREDDFIIFDFLEIHDQHFKVSGMINEIHAKLQGGICIIAIQKSSYKELGRGADYSMEKARLYLTLQSGVAKIMSGKNWHVPTRNPVGLVQEYKIVQGAKIIPQGMWHEDYEDDKKKKYY